VFGVGMIDHISIPVRDFAKAAMFYDVVLATIGLRRTKEREGAIGYGAAVGLPPEFWILEQHDPSAGRSGVGLHLSFRVKTRAEVHAFHEAALAHGGKDAGAPGVRPHYTAGFYGAFAHDLEGFKIEAVVREALPTNT
jgi:catechol 2,3-dioxygenase-like lactoylglutathione lyase family enzyme